MTTRLREMETLTELKELRLKVMELETQVQVSTNQLRRQDDEGKKIKEELEQALTREKEMANKAREQQHRSAKSIIFFKTNLSHFTCSFFQLKNYFF